MLDSSAFLNSEVVERVIAVPIDFTRGGTGGITGVGGSVLTPSVVSDFVMDLTMTTPETTRMIAAAISSGTRQLCGIRARTDVFSSGIGVSMGTEGALSTGSLIVGVS